MTTIKPTGGRDADDLDTLLRDALQHEADVPRHPQRTWNALRAAIQSEAPQSKKPYRIGRARIDLEFARRYPLSLSLAVNEWRQFAIVRAVI